MLQAAVRVVRRERSAWSVVQLVLFKLKQNINLTIPAPSVPLFRYGTDLQTLWRRRLFPASFRLKTDKCK